MFSVTVEVDKDVYDVLKTIAEIKGVSVGDVLRDMVTEDLERIKRRMNDPIIGMFSSGRSDVSENDEDIMYGNWKPD
jgi:hypothetical protein